MELPKAILEDLKRFIRQRGGNPEEPPTVGTFGREQHIRYYDTQTRRISTNNARQLGACERPRIEVHYSVAVVREFTVPNRQRLSGFLSDNEAENIDNRKDETVNDNDYGKTQ